MEQNNFEITKSYPYVMKQAEKLINDSDHSSFVFDNRNLIMDYAYKTADLEQTKQLIDTLANSPNRKQTLEIETEVRKELEELVSWHTDEIIQDIKANDFIPSDEVVDNMLDISRYFHRIVKIEYLKSLGKITENAMMKEKIESVNKELNQDKLENYLKDNPIPEKERNIVNNFMKETNSWERSWFLIHKLTVEKDLDLYGENSNQVLEKYLDNLETRQSMKEILQQELKAAGYQPKTDLVDNMQKLNFLLGSKTSLEEIKRFHDKEIFKDNPKINTFLSNIHAELKLQQQNSLTNNNSIQKIQKILSARNKEAAKDFSALVSYIDDMEINLKQITDELNTIKNQLGNMPTQIQNSKPETIPLKEILHKAVKNLENMLETTKEQIRFTKENLKNKAADITKSLPKLGKTALLKLSTNLEIEQTLSNLKKDLEKSTSSIKSTLEKIDTAGKELNALGQHAKNLGKVITSQEVLPVTQKNPKVTEILKKPWNNANQLLSESIQKIDHTITKLRALENTVTQENNLITEKPSEEQLGKKESFTEKTDTPSSTNSPSDYVEEPMPNTFDKETYKEIVQDIKASGLRPTLHSTKNILKLNSITNQKNTIADIKNFKVQGSFKDNPEANQLIDTICNEFKVQQLQVRVPDPIG